MRSLGPVVLFLCTACAPGLPAFPEPAWGGAPAPRADEVTELTLDHLSCHKSRCGRVVVVLRRDGGAYREFYTGSRKDSAEHATIDSAAFVEAASTLRERGFFGGREIEQREHGPTVTDSWILSAATYCRRRVQTYEAYPELRSRPPEVVDRVASVIAGLRWERIVYRL